MVLAGLPAGRQARIPLGGTLKVQAFKKVSFLLLLLDKKYFLVYIYVGGEKR
jgi:hypothetical protein